MVAQIAKSVSAKGATAYQDSSDPSKFYYIPNVVQLELGKTLLNFDVTYWGISKEHINQSGVNREPTVGAILAGQAVVDITDSQRDALTKEIRKAFNFDPKKVVTLTPLILKKTTSTQLTLAANTLNATDVNIPKEGIKIGTSFSYSVGAGNSNFAEFIAGTRANGAGITANPQFGFNMYNIAEMRGEPWSVKIEANLDQVWSYVRNKFDSGGGVGWFKASVSVDSIVQDLQVNGAVKVTFTQGSLDPGKFGDQLFEVGKTVFTAINAALNSKDGLFKLEPNPAIPEMRSPGEPSVLPSFNMSYQRQSLQNNQSVHFSSELIFNPTLEVEIPLNMILAVNPTPETSKFFRDMDDSSENLITQKKGKWF